MGKPSNLAGIDLDGLDIPKHTDKVKRFIKRESPSIKKGLRSVERDVWKTGKAVYDWLASDELEEKLK